MMNQNDAHSGANPESLSDAKPDATVEPAIHNHVDGDRPPFDVIDRGTPSEPASEFDDDDDDDDGPGYEVIYDSTLSKPVSEPAAAEPFAPAPLGTSRTLSLLEAHLDAGLDVVRDLAGYVRQVTSDIHTCIMVADSVGQLMRSSATLGKVAMRLQNGDPESRHRVIVEYAELHGGGVRQSRKRINHGRG